MKEIHERIDEISKVTTALLEQDKRAELGQFYTPTLTASFMSSLIRLKNEVVLLDAGAGSGALTATHIANLASCNKTKPKKITVYCFELDASCIKPLNTTLELCREECKRADIEFNYTVIEYDFIEYAVELLRDDLISSGKFKLPKFNQIILNPPYAKINSKSTHKSLLKSLGIESTNLYSAFVSLSAKLLEDDGELVAITPRSFCNGPYFTHFRRDICDNYCISHIHVFKSRTAAFKGDNVLQENIIFKLENKKQTNSVTITSTDGVDFENVRTDIQEFHDIVYKNDKNKFIHVVSNADELQSARLMKALPSELNELGLNVSTGPVVDFRLKEFIHEKYQNNLAPLFYATHFSRGRIDFTRPIKKKGVAIESNGKTAGWLVDNLRYVFVKRFTSKEENRRVVAAVYEPNTKLGKHIGIENHLNYFHSEKKALEENIAKGLTVYLNSKLVDDYFRIFNGHTQVNATDLRFLRYPNKVQLIALSEHYNLFVNGALEFDDKVNEVLSL